MSEPKHAIRFPNESDDYRSARNELLDAEIELRRHIEAVASKRRALPVGGAIPEDYVFCALAEDSEERPVKFSELFSEGKDTLIVYSFMYGPDMAKPCPACTSILDALDGEVQHVLPLVNVAIVAKSPIARISEFAQGRVWRNLQLLSSANNTYNHDYHAENEKGDQIPALNVFVRRDGVIHHFYNTELLYAPSDPGQHSRHVDSIWPMWNLFDLTPEGRGEKTHPQLSY